MNANPLRFCPCGFLYFCDDRSIDNIGSLHKLIFFYILKTQKKMELDKLDPNWQFAEMHGQSTHPGIPNHEKALKNGHLICPCCRNAIYKNVTPLCQNSKELQFLGFGFPLYFVFIKYCIVLLMINIASYNGISLYWAVSYNKNMCSSIDEAVISSQGTACSSALVSISRIDSSVTMEEDILRISSFFIHLCALIYIRDLITKTEHYYDERTCSLSDYSMLLIGLPEKPGHKRNLIKFLDQLRSTGESSQDHYQITSLTFLPEYQQFYRLREEKVHLIKKKKKLMNAPVQDKQENQKIEKELQEIEIKIEMECEKQIKMQENDEIPTSRLIFSCQTEHVKDEIMTKWEDADDEQLREAFCVDQDQPCQIHLDQAPQPKEIDWQNINYPEGKQCARLILGWFLTILFLGAITVMFFFLLSAKAQLLIAASASSHSARLLSTEPETHSTQTQTTSHDLSQHTNAVFIVYVAIFLVILFNKFVMGVVLHKICDIQLHPTTAKFEFHFAFKYSVGMFFTTALMTLAVEDIRFHNFYTHEYGVIQEESVMFFMNAYFVPIIWLINPWQLHVLIKRKLNYGRKDLTQEQANKMMQNMQYNMGKRYAQIIQTMWFTCLYASLIPFGAFMAILGLIIYYWVDKFNLLRRSSVNSNISGQLSLFSMKLLDFTLLARTLGQIIFDSQMRESFTIQSIVLSCIAFIYLVVPVDDILQFFHEEKFKLQEKHYQDVESTFIDTYQTLHPIFSKKRKQIAKMFEMFELVDLAAENTIQIFVKTPDQEAAHMNEALNSPSPLKDASNIMKSLFKKHDFYNFKEKDIND